MAITSCQKEINTNVIEQPTAKNQSPDYEYEQAYPGIQGELLKTKFNGVDIFVEKKMGHYIWMGDIAFDQETFDSLRKAENVENRTFKSTASNNWFKGEVFFSIDAGFTAAEQTRINDAINHWRNNTPLRFIQRTNELNYIRIDRGSAESGLFSDFVGMRGGQQIINLNGGDFITGQAIHEIGHAIGFYHEQSRTDRNNSIIVNYNNIFPNTQQNIYQFNTYAQNNEAGAQLGDFDFNSVMLYGSFAFSNPANPQPTITRLDGTFFIGQRIGLSAGDIETSNFIYGPPFVRFRYITRDYGGPDETYIEADIFADFFADAACTIPFTLATPRNIDIKVTESTYQAQWVYTNYIVSTQVPQGVNSILLWQNTILENIRYDYGNIMGGYRQEFLILNGFAR